MAATRHSFTTTYSKLVPVLQTDVIVTSPLQTNNKKKFVAIWDTGATGTCITPQLAKKLNLIPTGMTKSTGVHGTQSCHTYIVNITLPNKITVEKIKVVEVQLTPGSDVLIGMNIIALGDFALTHKDGKTILTFRVPSISSIDFAKEDGAYQLKQSTKRPQSKKTPSNVTPKKKKRKKRK